MPEFLGNRRNWLIGDRKQTHPTADRQTDRQTMILICVLDKWRNSRGGAYVLTNAVFKDITVKNNNKQTNKNTSVMILRISNVLWLCSKSGWDNHNKSSDIFSWQLCYMQDSGLFDSTVLVSFTVLFCGEGPLSSVVIPSK